MRALRRKPNDDADSSRRQGFNLINVEPVFRNNQDEPVASLIDAGKARDSCLDRALNLHTVGRQTLRAGRPPPTVTRSST